MANNSIYKVEIFDPAGNLVADLTGLEIAKKVQKTRNDADNLSCTFSLDKIRDYAESLQISITDLFNVRVNELRLSKRGTVISAGQIQTLSRGLEDGNRTINVSAVGWFGLLARYFTDQSFDYSDGMTDGGQIAVDLLNDAQGQTNGDIGITVGTIKASTNQVATYQIYKCIKDAISELSAMYNSFDFEVTWDKFFNVYYPGIGSQKNTIPILVPGNIKNLTVTNDGTILANKVIAQGAGSQIVATSNDLVSQGVYGLQTVIENYSDITDPTMLQQRADADLVAYSGPLVIPEVTLDGAMGPDVTQIGIGDQLKFVVAPREDGFQDLNNNYFRVESFVWSVDADNNEELRLVLAG